MSARPDGGTSAPQPRISPTKTCRASRNCLNVAFYQDKHGNPACGDHRAKDRCVHSSGPGFCWGCQDGREP